MKLQIRSLFQFLFIFLSLSLSFSPYLSLQAEDKSASRSGLVNLPSAGGTVQKESGSFGIQGNTGSADFSLPLPPLPTRGGMSPGVSLEYTQFAGDSGSGVGIGWSFNTSSIEMNHDKGTTLRGFKSNGDFFNRLSFKGSRLVFLGAVGGTGPDKILNYALESASSYSQIVYHTSNFTIEILGASGEKVQVDFPAGFVVKEPNGHKLVFTASPDEAEGDFTLAPNLVSRFPLSLEVAPNGEAVRYHYMKQGGRAYLKQISFAGGKSRYLFEHIDTPASLVSYQNSFRQTNGKLYAKVTALFDGAVREQWCFAYIGRSLTQRDEHAVRAHPSCQTFAEKDLAAAIDLKSLNVLDQLKMIYRYGNDAVLTAQTLRHPNIHFNYSSWTANDLQGRDVVYEAPALKWAADMPPQNFELADLNMDSLVDVVQSSASHGSKFFVGTGDLTNSFQDSKEWFMERPSTSGETVKKVSPILGDNKFHFADLNGDTYIDVLEVEPGILQVFLGDQDGKFTYIGKTIPLGDINPSMFERGQARFMDMNMDGLSDIITTFLSPEGVTKFRLYLNMTTYKPGTPIKVNFGKMEGELPFHSTEANLLTRPEIRLEDINGDKLPDLIQIKGGQGGFCFYENQGHVFDKSGKTLFFGQKGTNTNQECKQGKFATISGLSPTDRMETMWYLDVNGDGIVDFANMGTSVDKMKVWPGLGDGSYLEKPIELNLNLRVQVGSQPKGFMSRVSDLDGDGQSEIIVFQKGSGEEVLPVVVIDFNRVKNIQLIKANLLTTVEFETGLRHDVKYATSTDEWLRDHRLKVKHSNLHFPVVLAKQVATSDQMKNGIRQNAGVTEYLYHDPYFDPIDKRFLGFKVVEKIVYGDEYLNQKSTQKSLYSLEEYYGKSDERLGDLARYLSGKIKLVQTYAFTPTGEFSTEGQRSSTLDVRSATLHSLSFYAQKQNLPAPGAILSENATLWNVVPQPAGNGTYYLQKVEEVSKEFPVSSSSSASSNPPEEKVNTITSLYLDFDAYNLPARERSKSSRVQGPTTGSGTGTTAAPEVPETAYETQRSYEAARSQLSGLGIMNSPSEVKKWKLTGAGSLTSGYQPTELLTQQNYTYHTENGKVLTEKTLKKSFLKDSSIPVALKGKLRQGDGNEVFMVTYEYDNYANKVKVTDDLGLVEKVQYDSSFGIFPVVQQNGLGHTTRMFYGDLGPSSGASAPAEMGGGAGGQNGLKGLLTHYQDVLGSWYKNDYDSMGRKIKVKDNLGKEEFYQYKSGLNFKPSLIKTSVRRYKEEDNLPQGETRFIQKLEAYHPNGTKIASVENAEGGGGRVLSFSHYNRNKKLILEWMPFKTAKTVNTIFEEGDIPKPTGEEAAAVKFSYDELGRTSRKIFVSGDVDGDSYKSKRTVTFQYFPWGESMVNSFDDLWEGKVHSKSQKISRKDTTYGIIDPLGHVYRFDRNSMGQLERIRLPEEKRDRLLYYNNLGKLEMQVIPGVGTFGKAYDARGNVLNEYRLDNEGKLEHTVKNSYDFGNRLFKVEVDDVVISEIFYDTYPTGFKFKKNVPGVVEKPLGLITMARSHDVNDLYAYRVAVGYNSTGHLIQKEALLGDQEFSESYQYTLDGVPQGMTDALGVKSTFGLGPSMLLVSAHLQLPWAPEKREPVISEVAYNQKGLLSKILYRKGAKTLIAYDPETMLMSRVQSFYQGSEAESGSGSDIPLQDLSFRISGNGSINEVVDHLAGAASSQDMGLVNRSGTYRYNLRNELVEAKKFGRTFTYQYNAAGNFILNSEFSTQAMENGSTTSGSTSSQETSLIPLGNSGKPYTYNKLGQMVSGGKVLLNRYDGLDRLVSTKTKESTIFYGYDFKGRRIYKKVIPNSGSTPNPNTKPKISLYPFKTIAIEPESAQSYVFLGDNRLARVEHSKKQWFYYLKDQIGSSDIVMNPDGLPVEQMLYKPFGGEFEPSSESANWKKHLEKNKNSLPLERTHHRYAGQYLDDSSGLYYMYKRYYDPDLGRFITPDNAFINAPDMCLGRPLECNLYSYAINNPMTYIDPTGETGKAAQKEPTEDPNKGAAAPTGGATPTPGAPTPAANPNSHTAGMGVSAAGVGTTVVALGKHAVAPLEIVHGAYEIVHGTKEMHDTKDTMGKATKGLDVASGFGGVLSGVGGVAGIKLVGVGVAAGGAAGVATAVGAGLAIGIGGGKVIDAAPNFVIHTVMGNKDGKDYSVTKAMADMVYEKDRMFSDIIQTANGTKRADGGFTPSLGLQLIEKLGL